MTGANVSGDKKQDRAQIEQAARAVADRDYPHFRAAVQYAQDFTTLDQFAFGTAPSGALLPRYGPARDTQVKNLHDGLDRLEKMIAGMTEVAYRMSVTEAANTIDLNSSPKVLVTKPTAPKATSGGFGALRLGATIGFLYSNWRLCSALKSSFGVLMPGLIGAGAVTSLLMWATVVPDDNQIGTVKSAWQMVQSELNSLTGIHLLDSTGEGALLPRSAWDDDAREAFDRWVRSFQVELDEAVAAARDGHDALDDALDAIHELHDLMRECDIATLVALLTLMAASYVPFLTLQARAAQQAITIINALATACTVVIMVAEISSYGSMMGLVSDGSRFHELQIDNAPDREYGDQPVRDTFVDLDIDWLKS
ncbi:hypothetical protein [Actinopolymorpha pittospori]|uniref:hypothetical protein n=1 Tax=Actinopolymorpha pittospori TaxID=648752 RepID=UPI0031E57D6E